MEPTVRGAWTQSGIAAAPSRSRIAAAQNPEYGFNCARTSRSATAAGNGIFGCRDRAPKTVAKMCERLQRQKSEKRVAGNPRRNALFGVVLETCGLRRLDGGGSRAQTEDPPPSHRTNLGKRAVAEPIRNLHGSGAGFVKRLFCSVRR